MLVTFIKDVYYSSYTLAVNYPSPLQVLRLCLDDRNTFAVLPDHDAMPFSMLVCYNAMLCLMLLDALIWRRTMNANYGIIITESAVL